MMSCFFIFQLFLRTPIEDTSHLVNGPLFLFLSFFSSGKGTHLTDPIILYTLTRSAGNLHTITIATTTYPEKITEEYPQWRIFFPSIFCLPDMFYE